MSVYNDYFQCYYNKDPTQILRKSVDDKWGLHLNITGNCKIKSFKEEVLNSCELMYDAFKIYTSKLNLFFSGGMDSECMLRCFTELKIPVNPVIIIHCGEESAPEAQQALRICKELSLVPTIINIDLSKLFGAGVCHDIGEKYRTKELAMVELLYVMEKLQEPSILCDDIQLFYHSSSKNKLSKSETNYQQWFYSIREDHDGVFDRFEYITGIPVFSDTYKFTKESWAAMLMTPVIQDIVLNKRGKASGKSSKNKMMSAEFGAEWREKTAVFSSGNILRITRALHKDLGELIPVSNTHTIEYFKLLSLLGAYESI